MSRLPPPQRELPDGPGTVFTNPGLSVFGRALFGVIDNQ